MASLAGVGEDGRATITKAAAGSASGIAVVSGIGRDAQPQQLPTGGIDILYKYPGQRSAPVPERITLKKYIARLFSREAPEPRSIEVPRFAPFVKVSEAVGIAAGSSEARAIGAALRAKVSKATGAVRSESAVKAVGEAVAARVIAARGSSRSTSTAEARGVTLRAKVISAQGRSNNVAEVSGVGSWTMRAPVAPSLDRTAELLDVIALVVELGL